MTNQDVEIKDVEEWLGEQYKVRLPTQATRPPSLITALVDLFYVMLLIHIARHFDKRNRT